CIYALFYFCFFFFFFFQAEDGIRDRTVTGVQTCALPIYRVDTLVYLRGFNAILARTDVLWTKPSELTFFAALGLPLLAAPPIGVHEQRNLRWALDAGAVLPQGEPRFAADWLLGWIEDGTLARAAWNGYRQLRKLGLYEIVDALAADGA